MNIIKRDGSTVLFDRSKIKNAILKANNDINQNFRISGITADDIAKSIEIECKAFDHTPKVDEVQDMVEDALIETGYTQLGKRYIKYRHEHDLKRQQQHYKNVKEKLMAENVQNQNANVDEHSFGGRIGEMSDYVSKQYALDYCMSKMARENHLNNEIYIHDLSHYAVGDHNCASRNTIIKIKHNNIIESISIGDFADRIGLKENQIAEVMNYSILSRDGWTKLNNISCRSPKENELLYTIKTRSGIPLKLTGEHQLPVIRDGKEILLEVKDIQKGDSLLDIEQCNIQPEELQESYLDLTLLDDEKLNLRIVDIEQLKHYLAFKYNLNLLQYARQNNFQATQIENGKKISFLTPTELNKIIEDFPLSFDIISSLKLKCKGSKNKYPLYIPYTPELAKIYAYIYADGGVYVKEDGSLFQLTFTNTNENLVDDFINCYESVFGKRLNKVYPAVWHTSPCIRVTDGSRLIVKLFHDFAGAKKYGANDISLPNFILNGDKKIKLAFLSAAIDTDGCLGDTLIQYTTCSERYTNQIMTILKELGYHPHCKLAFPAGSTYRFGKKSGVRNFNCYNISITRNDECYLLQKDLDCFKYNSTYSYKGISKIFNENKIISITTEPLNDCVFDIETMSHWFIANNYVSHNCLTMPLDKLLANGFNTRQTDVRPAQSVDTAMQLTAVLFQLQSLNMFGGVAASHIDWTMVPYVRKSFAKHYNDGMKYIEGKETHYDGSLSIEDEEYSKNAKVLKYAQDQTRKETFQAAESLLHNLRN